MIVKAEHLEHLLDENERLTAALHRVQKHPDFRYCMTFEGSDAHKPLDGWEPNPEMLSGYQGNANNDSYRRRDTPKQLYWMKRKEA